jgi:hypothetical protein
MVSRAWGAALAAGSVAADVGAAAAAPDGTLSVATALQLCESLLPHPMHASVIQPSLLPQQGGWCVLLTNP